MSYRREPARAGRRQRAAAQVIGACLGFCGGILYGTWVVATEPGALGRTLWIMQVALLLFALAGAAAMGLLAPLVTVDLFAWVSHFLDEAPMGEIIGAVAGLIVALVIAALVSILLGGLPYGVGIALSVVLAGALSYLGVRTGRRRQAAIPRALAAAAPAPRPDPAAPSSGDIVVDTSVLIDGRVLDVAKTGFLTGRLILAGFVLEELQRVADSADPMRRQRGRRGLDIVRQLQELTEVETEIVDADFPGSADVDVRLMKLARLRHALLMTQDYNLNRLASVEGIHVLNLNELGNALRPIASSGDELRLRIVKEGREPAQGVGYLDDGTMVVVEGGRRHVGETIRVMVVSVLQTAAGRMVFAQLPDGAAGEQQAARP